MLTSGPPVTIGMPIRNCARTVARAIRSILRQTHANWELLIYDDGSTDGTLDVVRSFDDPRIRVLSDGTSKRIAVRLNEMIALGGGDYFARMDGDDVAYPERLARQVAYLQSHCDVHLAGCSLVCFWGEGRAYGLLNQPELHAGICRDPVNGFALIHPTWLGRTDWFRTNHYDPAMPVAQDYELLLRTHRTSRFANVPEILLGYNVPPVQLRDYLPRRWWQAKTLWKYYIGRGHALQAVRAAAMVSARSVYTTLGVVLGQAAELVKRRCAPLTDQVLREWQTTYASVS